jgi:hypothetical protein
LVPLDGAISLFYSQPFLSISYPIFRKRIFLILSSKNV